MDDSIKEEEIVLPQDPKIDKIIKEIDGIIVKFEDKWNLDMESDFNWEAMTKNKDKKLMTEYSDLRKVIVTKLLQFCIQYVGCDCNTSDVGSKNITSDIDITITGDKTAQVIELFHGLFDRIFHQESSDVFDTNLYGVGFYDPVKNTTGKNRFFEILPYVNKNGEKKYVKYVYIVECREGLHINATAHFKKMVPVKGICGDQIIDDQHVWAMIKLILHLDSDEFEYIESLFASGEVSDEFKRLYEDALVIVSKLPELRSHEALIRYTEQLKVVQKFEDKFKSITSGGENNKNNIKNSKQTIDIEQVGQIARKYQDAISLANYYANESYFTRGAFFHIVGQQQSGINSLPILYDEYVDSLIENVAETLRTINVYKNKVLASKYNCFDLLIDISKYYFRSKDALLRLQELSGEIDPVTENLRNDLGNIVTKFRGNPDIKEMTKKQVYDEFAKVSNFHCTNLSSENFEEIRKTLLKDLFLSL